MEMEISRVIRPGDEIRVFWGHYGEIKAVVSRIGANGEVFAKRPRPKFKNYTGPRRVFAVHADELGNIYDIALPKAKGEEVLM